MKTVELPDGHARFKELLTPYCFGDAANEERMSFEIHLLECDTCWDELLRVEAAVQVLRTDRGLLEKFLTPSVIGLFGISGRVQRFLGGHSLHALFASFLYTLLFVLSLVYQSVHDFNSARPLTWWVSAACVLPWVWFSAFFALCADWKLTIQGKTSGLPAAIGILGLSIVPLVAGVSIFFHRYFTLAPDAPSYPTAADYVKGATYYFPYAVLFFLVPFHFVIAVQRELRKERHHSIFGLLTGSKAGIPPRGAIFVKVGVLALILAAIGLLSVPMTATLFDHFTQDSSKGLLMFLILLRNLMYFTLGVECLMWYSWSLNELKRECLTVLKDLALPTL